VRAFCFRINFEDLDLEFLAHGEHVFRLGDAGMRDVADVEKTIDAAEVNERAVGHEGADGAGDDIAFFDGGLQRVAGGLSQYAGLFFKNHAAIDDDILVHDVELGDAAGDFRADQFFEFDGVFGAATACGHKGANADIDRQAALDDLGHGADDGELLSEGCFNGGPVAYLGHFETGKLVVMLFIAAGDGDWHGVAGLYAFGVVGKAERGRTPSVL